MKHIRSIKENFFKKGMEKVGDFIFGKPIEIPKLDDVTKKYTEQDLFDATEESFKEGYITCSGSGQTHDNIKNDSLLNYHKKWFLSIKNTSNFKKI